MKASTKAVFILLLSTLLLAGCHVRERIVYQTEYITLPDTTYYVPYKRFIYLHDRWQEVYGKSLILPDTVAVVKDSELHFLMRWSEEVKEYFLKKVKR